MWVFWHTRAINTKTNIPIWTEFEYFRDFIHVKVLCNFHKYPIKTNSNSNVKSPFWPKSKTFRDFMVVQIFCKFHKDSIKLSSLCSGQGRIYFFSTNGQVTPKSIFRSGRNSKPIEILCLSRLSVK